MIRFFLLSLIFISFSGCTSVITGIYGFKNPKNISQKQLVSQGRKYGIPLENSFELDPAYYSTFLKSFDTIQYGLQVKNHYQPLQALYFDKTGRLQNFQINCYAGGFPNLNWNRNGNFETFPPKLQAPVDSLLNYQTLQQYLNPVSPPEPILKVNSDDYVVVVFWSRLMGRQSKRLIKMVKENTSLAINKKVKLVFVNNDKLLYKLWQ